MDESLNPKTKRAAFLPDLHFVPFVRWRHLQGASKRMKSEGIKTSELLESLIAGDKMSPDTLDELVSEPVAEDLFLEYKHGNLLAQSEAPRMIREYLSGFANSAGGVLIVGVDQANWSITGCRAPGGEDLAEWASRCLTPIAPYFSPLPRFQVVQHSEGDVLVASTDRSLGLVPCVEAGQLVYYLRLHDQTLKAPEYLISDILLGRRQQPYFHITDCSLVDLETCREAQSGEYDLCFSPLFICENDSLFRPDYVRVGIVSWSKYPVGRGNVSNHLLSYIEVRDIDRQRYSGPCNLVHIEKIFPGIGSFDVGVFKAIDVHTVPLSVYDQWYIPYSWKAALYLMSESAPVWYQLSVTISSDLLVCLRSETSLSSASGLFEVKRMSGERPVVVWEYG